MYKKVFYKCFPVLLTTKTVPTKPSSPHKVPTAERYTVVLFYNAHKVFVFGVDYVQILMLK